MPRDDDDSPFDQEVAKFEGPGSQAVAVQDPSDPSQRHYKEDKAAQIHVHRDGSRTATRVGRSLVMIDGGHKGSVLVEVEYNIQATAGAGMPLPNIGGSMDRVDKPKQIRGAPSYDGKAPTASAQRPFASSRKSGSVASHTDPDDDDDDSYSTAPTFVPRPAKTSPTPVTAGGPRKPQRRPLLDDGHSMASTARTKPLLDDAESLAPTHRSRALLSDEKTLTGRHLQPLDAPVPGGAPYDGGSIRSRPLLVDERSVAASRAPSRATTKPLLEDGKTLAGTMTRSPSLCQQQKVDEMTMVSRRTGSVHSYHTPTLATHRTKQSATRLLEDEDGSTIATSKTGRTGRLLTDDDVTIATRKTGRSTINLLPDGATVASMRTAGPPAPFSRSRGRV